MFSEFKVIHKGKSYIHPDGVAFKDAFIVWLNILKSMNGICFRSMDFNPTIESMLDEKKVVNNERDLGLFFDLQDD